MKIEDALKISKKVRRSHWHINDWIEVTSISHPHVLTEDDWEPYLISIKEFSEDDWEPFVEPSRKQTKEVWEWRFWKSNYSNINGKVMTEKEAQHILERDGYLGMEKLRGPFIIEVKE